MNIGKRTVAAAGIVLIGSAIVACADAPRMPESTASLPVGASHTLSATVLSPTDQRILTAQQAVDRSPAAVDGYNQLAAAFLHKARESGDFGFNAKAEAAVQRALVLEPENIGTLKLQATVLAAFHRFAEALTIAQRARTLRPDDYEVYSPLVDALVELGRYPEAVQAAQTMVNLHPGTAAYARVSYLRSLHGDSAGAVAAMRLAVQSANPQDPESGAWCRVHLGDELMAAAAREEAEQQYDQALALLPDYPLALAAKARARMAAGDLTAAVEWYQRAQNRVPAPDTAIALGNLYTKLGRASEAKRQYALLEFIEGDGAGMATYSRQLALFWADHDQRLDEALAIARRESAVRADIYTADVLAWTLYKKGEFAEAKQAMDEALRLGTRDSRLAYHAAMIHQALGDRAAARKSLQLTLSLDPAFDVLQADAARVALRDLQG